MQVMCGKCRHNLNATADDIRKGIECPQCGHMIGLPANAPSGSKEGEDGFANMAREAMGQKFRLVCGACGVGIRVPLRKAGKKIICPACKNHMMAPYPEQNEERILRKPTTRLRWPLEESKGEDGPLLSGDSDLIGDELDALAGAADEASLDSSRRREESIDLLDVSNIPAETHAHRAKRNIRILWPVLLLALGIMAVGSWLAWEKYGPSRGDWPSDDTSPTGGDTKLIVPRHERPVKKPGPKPAHTTRTERPRITERTKPAPGPSEPAGELVTRCVVSEVTLDTSGNKAQKVASAGNAFCTLKVKMVVGADPLWLTAKRPDIALGINGKEYYMSGELRLAGMNRTSKITIPAGTVVQLNLRFEVPCSRLVANGLDAMFRVGDAPCVPISFGKSEHVQASEALAGEFIRAASVGIDVESRDPFIAAFADAGMKGMDIRVRKTGRLTVAVGEGMFTSTATRADDGLYDVIFERAGRKMACRMRFAYGGKEVIVYCGGEGRPHVTFRKEDWKKVVPAVNQKIEDGKNSGSNWKKPDGAPEFFGV